MIEQNNIETIFKALDRQMEVHGGSPMGLVVCGGTALAMLGLVARTTKDVDVLATTIEKGESISLHKIDKFPAWFDKAASAVQRDFGLPDEWINVGPTSQVDSGLPVGFVIRLVKHSFGSCLTVYFISRIDQIHFKLYAAQDRGGYHITDLWALEPTEEELELASRWVLTQDVSAPFRSILVDFLQRHGYDDIVERL